MSKYYVTSGDIKDIVDTKRCYITDTPLDAAAFALNRAHKKIDKQGKSIDIDGRFYVDERGHLTGNASFIFSTKKVFKRAGWVMESNDQECDGI